MYAIILFNERICDAAMKIKAKYKGVFFILIASLCFALMATCVRLAGDIPSVQKAFFRNIVAFAFALIMTLKDGGGIHIQKGSLKFLIIRALAGTAGLLLYFWSIDNMALADATMLNKMSPFFAVICSYFFLKEKLTPVQLISVIVAFVGSLFVVKPSFDNVELIPALGGLVGGFAAGAAYTVVRKLGQLGEKQSVIILFFSGTSCLIILPALVFNFVPMTPSQLTFLLLAGLFACGGQFSITTAYCCAPAREISVFDYSQIIYTTILGFLLFGQVPDTLSFIGYFIICATAVAMFFYNKRRAEKGL